jgi:hypothetical protein
MEVHTTNTVFIFDLMGLRLLQVGDDLREKGVAALGDAFARALF